MYETPEFVTKPQTLLVNEGDTIRLPCFVNRLEVGVRIRAVSEYLLKFSQSLFGLSPCAGVCDAVEAWS